MPARKPRSLITRDETKEVKQARADHEDALTPHTKLTAQPPSTLTRHPHAKIVWKRMVNLYRQVDGQIVTSFDRDLLAKYCLIEEELIELEELRKQIKSAWERHLKILEDAEVKSDDMKWYFNALAQANALLQRFQGMDARIDGKRKLLFAMSQSMYLTPRSRAGVAPPEKPPEQPKDNMEKLLEKKKNVRPDEGG